MSALISAAGLRMYCLSVESYLPVFARKIIGLPTKIHMKCSICLVLYSSLVDFVVFIIFEPQVENQLLVNPNFNHANNIESHYDK